MKLKVSLGWLEVLLKTQQLQVKVLDSDGKWPGGSSGELIGEAEVSIKDLMEGKVENQVVMFSL